VVVVDLALRALNRTRQPASGSADPQTVRLLPAAARFVDFGVDHRDQVGLALRFGTAVSGGHRI
jgi:hypothetical protein